MKRTTIFQGVFSVMLLAAWAGFVLADEPKPKKADAKPGLTVAVLDFAAEESGGQVGKNIGEAVTAMLSGENGFTLVDRQAIARTLQEQELNLTGIVDTDKAVKVGKLVGAKIMVVGRAFNLGDQLVVTAKLIGTETSLVESVMVKGKPQDLASLTMEAAAKIAERLRTSGRKLIAADDEAVDPMPALKAALAKKKKPVVAVIVREQHHAGPQPAVALRPIDPAVETEIKKMLVDCGFTVKDVAANELTSFASGWTANDVNSWPRGLADVDVLIAGEAFSEFAARIGNLVSCSGRAELNVVSRKDGKIMQAERVTVRAVDLSEQIAGKTALQKAGRAAGLRVLEQFRDSLPPAKK